MISFEEAYETALAAARPLPDERVALAASFKRILAEDVVADMPMPPFDKAMVDGYACRRADLQQALKCVETIAAGYEPQQAVAAGELGESIRYATHGLGVTEGSAELIVVRAAALALDGRWEAARRTTVDAQERQAEDISVKLVRAICDAGEGRVETSRKALDELRRRVSNSASPTPLQRILLNELSNVVARTTPTKK